MAEVLPLLYPHGLSSGDFVPALEQFLGSAAGLSAATVARLTSQWQDDAEAFGERSLADSDYVYLWVDGIPLKVRLKADKVCLLVMIGVPVDGAKELIALTDGFRQSSESWADLLRDCKRRGMGAPVLAVGDGALGFWKALREVFPDTREQRCWFYKIASLPKSAHPGAKAALAEVYNTEDKDHAIQAAKAIAATTAPSGPRPSRRSQRPRRPRRVLRLPRRTLDPPTDHEPDRIDLLHRPASRARHQGPGSRAAGIAMAFKLIKPAQAHWRAVNAPLLVALVRAGATFSNDKLVERPDESPRDAHAHPQVLTIPQLARAVVHVGR